MVERGCGRSARSWTRAGAIALSPLLLLLAGGCAHVWTDAQGVRHVIGLVSMEMPDPGAGNAEGGEFVRIAAMGLSLVRSGGEAGLALGYQSYGSVWMSSNACVMPRAAQSPASTPPGGAAGGMARNGMQDQAQNEAQNQAQDTTSQPIPAAARDTVPAVLRKRGSEEARGTARTAARQAAIAR